mgnify:CR=1 FL=1
MLPTDSLLDRLSSELTSNGFAMIKGLFNPIEVAQLSSLADSIDSSEWRTLPGRTRFAVRDVQLRSPELAAAVRDSSLMGLARKVLGLGAQPVGAILFDKPIGANWKVPPHQDLLIPVKKKVDVAGYSGWCLKQGVQYVSPPDDVLREMLAFRVHLDSCPADAGALRVIPGSHTRRLHATDWSTSSASDFSVCQAEVGDCLMMRPLLIHRSNTANNPNRRRVLHVLMTARNLTGGLELTWPAADSIDPS